MSEPVHKLDLDLDKSETAALAVAGGGAVILVLGLIVHSRVLRVLGLVGVAAGGALYSRARLAERSEKIDAAANHIQSELDDLDPVAQAQVIQRLAQS